MFSFKVLGLANLLRNMDKAKAFMNKLPVAKAGAMIERQAKKRLTSGPDRAIDTGTLRSQTVVRELTPFRATIYPLVEYGIYVHEGTRYMRERPFLKHAVEDMEDEIQKLFEDHLEGGFGIL